MAQRLVSRPGETPIYANVTIDSILIPFDQLELDMVDAIRNACVAASVKEAVRLWGPAQALTVRDLNGADMGYPNNVMTDTAVTANAWAAMGFGAFTVSTATVIGIYGVKILINHQAAILHFAPISSIRIDVGGARVAQWCVQSLIDEAGAASTTPSPAYGGVTESPIIVGEDITVTIYEYTRTTGGLYDAIWLGVTIEKEGRTLKP